MTDPISISYYSRSSKRVTHKWVSENNKFQNHEEVKEVLSMVLKYNSLLRTKNAKDISLLYSSENNKIPGVKTFINRSKIKEMYDKFFNSFQDIKRQMPQYK